jgi:hypothetical protein
LTHIRDKYNKFVIPTLFAVDSREIDRSRKSAQQVGTSANPESCTTFAPGDNGDTCFSRQSGSKRVSFQFTGDNRIPCIWVLGIIVNGTYPILVKAAVEGNQFSISDAIGKAYHRFWALFGAGILVGLIVFFGAIALIVPGIILALWYVYTIPAIMLENLGGTSGMSASKAFGRNKKGSTFLIFLAVGVLYAIMYVVFDFFVSAAVSPIVGQSLGQLLEIPLATWVSIIISYTYITYGPSSVSPPPGDSNTWVPPAYPTQRQNMQTDGSQSRFCASCGSSLELDSKFCPACGRAV